MRYLEHIIPQLKLLHKLGYAYGNICSRSFLLGRRLNYPILWKYSYAVLMSNPNENRYNKCEINAYAPEIIQSQSYGEKSDIFALGCFIYELYTFRKLFDHSNAADMNREFTSGKDPIPANDNNKQDNILKNLLRKMIDYDSYRRISLDNLDSELKNMLKPPPPPPQLQLQPQLQPQSQSQQQVPLPSTSTAIMLPQINQRPLSQQQLTQQLQPTIAPIPLPPNNNSIYPYPLVEPPPPPPPPQNNETEPQIDV